MEGASPLPNQPPPLQGEILNQPYDLLCKEETSNHLILLHKEDFEPLLKFLANRWQGT